MSIHVKSYKAKRGSKTVTIKPHSRTGEKTNFKKYELASIKQGKYVKTKSSFIDRVEERPDGGLNVIIKGRSYPYPYAGKPQLVGMVSSKSTGSFYNKNIRGKFF